MMLLGQLNESDVQEKDSSSSISMPVQPFYQWLKEEGRSTISASHPGISPAEIVRLATIMWDDMDQDIRGAYEAQYTAAVEAWKHRIKGKNPCEKDNHILCTLEEEASEEMIVDEPKGVVQDLTSNSVTKEDDVLLLKGKKKIKFLMDTKKAERGKKLRAASNDWLAGKFKSVR